MPRAARCAPTLLCALCVLSSVSASSHPDATPAAQDAALHPELARLVTLIAWRAELMRDVARYKHRNDLPVAAPQREAVVLRRAAADAAALGLDPARSRAFFRAQIELAKGIQRHWIERWRSAGAPGAPALELERVLRPAILAAGERILAQLQRVVPRLAPAHGNGAHGERRLHAALTRALAPLGAEPAHIDTLAAGLAEVRYAEAPAPSVLDRVAGGQLRVGTTGDYRPFSWERDGELHGIAVTLARRLADTLDAELVFVRTSWPALLDDLRAGRFDIAMSGISRRLFRQRAAYLADPYYRGGKTPIARCEDVERLDSLEAIDREGVRVLVNPGGTNERFARRRLERAAIRVIPDNRRIFAALLAGEGDVMITDAIEVRLQSRLHEGLCPTMPGQRLTFTEKGFLLPRGDEPWLRYVNAWLHELRETSELAAILERHLAPAAD